jgi:hypothetical protein
MSASNKYKIEYKDNGQNKYMINIKKLDLFVYINKLDPSRSLTSWYRKGWIRYETKNNIIIEDTLVSMLKSKNTDDVNLAFEILSNRF